MSIVRWCLALVCLVVAGCAGSESVPGSPTPPSSSSSVSTTQAAPPAPGPVPPGASSTAPIFSITGPSGCVPLTTPSRWLLDVASAGAGFHLIVAAFTDGHANCEETRDHPATHITIDGPLDYTANGKGQTIFDYPAETCGRVQFDLGMVTADGKEQLIVGTVLNSGKECDPPPAPTCADTPSLCSPRSSPPPSTPPPPTPPPSSPPECRHPKEHHCPGPKTCHTAACAGANCHRHR